MAKRMQLAVLAAVSAAIICSCGASEDVPAARRTVAAVEQEQQFKASGIVLKDPEHTFEQKEIMHDNASALSAADATNLGDILDEIAEDTDAE